MMYLLIAGRTLIAAVAQSCVAQLARMYNQGMRSAFYTLIARQMTIGLLLGGAGILISLVAGKSLP